MGRDGESESKSESSGWRRRMIEGRESDRLRDFFVWTLVKMTFEAVTALVWTLLPALAGSVLLVVADIPMPGVPDTTLLASYIVTHFSAASVIFLKSWCTSGKQPVSANRS